MSNFTNNIENTELGALIKAVKDFNVRYKNDINILKKGVITPENTNEIRGIFYQLALKSWSLSIFNSRNDIDLFKFKNDFKNLCTTNSLRSLLKNIFNAHQVIIENIAPATINIIIMSPQQFNLKEYVDTETETKNYNTLDNPDAKYITNDIGNFVGNTSTNLFKDLIKQFISSTVIINDIQIINNDDIEFVNIPDPILKNYLLSFVSGSEISIIDAHSGIFETLIIDNIEISNLTGLEAFISCRNLTLTNLNQVEDFTPILSLPLENLTVSNCQNFNAGILTNTIYLKNIYLDNTNTVNLYNLSNNIILENFTIKNNNHIITDFRPLGNKLNLQPITVLDNVIELEVLVNNDILTYNSEDVYGIDGNVLPISSSIPTGDITGNEISWTGIDYQEVYTFNKEGLKGEVINYRIQPLEIINIPNVRFKAFLNNILGQEPNDDITAKQALDPVFNTLIVPDLEFDIPDEEADRTIFIGLENFKNIEHLTVITRRFQTSPLTIALIADADDTQLIYLTNLKTLQIDAVINNPDVYIKNTIVPMINNCVNFETLTINGIASGTGLYLVLPGSLINIENNNPILFNFNNINPNTITAADISNILEVHPNWVFNVTYCPANGNKKRKKRVK